MPCMRRAFVVYGLKLTGKRFSEKHFYYFAQKFIVLKAALLILFIGLSSWCCQAQDSSSLSKLEGYRHWTRFRTCPRVGVGVQKSFYTELGIERSRFAISEGGGAFNTYYASLEWIPTVLPEKSRNIYGAKIGGEIAANYLNYGLELKYQSDGKKQDLVVTPKAGLGFFGLVEVFYGYNFSFNKHPFEYAAQNQLSLIININRKAWRVVAGDGG